MKEYEIFTVLDPSLDEAGLDAFAQALSNAVGASGTVTNKEIRLNQSLAYPLKRHLTGHTVKLELSSEHGESLASAVRSHFSAEERVLRHILLVRSSREKTADEPISIIAEMRGESRAKAREQKIAPTPLTPPLDATASEKKDEQVDEKEIDKRIEELLK
jgi:ribosomal protein S6